MVLVPALPPPRFTWVPFPSVQFSREYSLSPPIASSPSVFRLVDRPPPVLPVVTRCPFVESIQPSDGLLADAMLPLVSCPEYRSMKVCSHTCAAGSTWFGCELRGVGDGAPLNAIDVLNASIGVAYPRRKIRRHLWTLVNDRGARPYLTPPPPFPIQPYLS